MSRAIFAQEFSKVDVDHWHIPVWASHSTFHFFVASSLNLWLRMMACVVRQWPRGSPAEGMDDCFHLHCQAGGCTVFTDGGRTLLDSESLPWGVFGDWGLAVCCLLNEKLDLRLFCLLAILDTAFPGFLAGVCGGDAGIGVGTFRYFSHFLVCLNCVSVVGGVLKTSCHWVWSVGFKDKLSVWSVDFRDKLSVWSVGFGYQCDRWVLKTSYRFFFKDMLSLSVISGFLKTSCHCDRWVLNGQAISVIGGF